MILSMAHAEVEKATREHLYGEWSELIVGDRPAGLVACYLTEDDISVQVIAIWSDQDAHDRAVGDERSHPAYLVFDAAGLDPQHTIMKVIGSVRTEP